MPILCFYIIFFILLVKIFVIGDGVSLLWVRLLYAKANILTCT